MDESTLSPGARRALATYRAQTKVPLPPARREARWRAAVAASSSNRWAINAFALCASCLVGAVAVKVISAPPPEVQASKTSQWERKGNALALKVGQLRLQPQVKLEVATAQLQAVVQNSVVLFETTQDATTISVESGQVVWRSSSKNGVVTAGHSIRVEALVPEPTLTLVPAIARVEGCAQGVGYEKCLAREVGGTGLAAQTALYALGMLAHERALLNDATGLFRTYGERFPTGVFAPEASIALMVDLRQQGKLEEAREEAAQFATRFVDEPRRADVARWAEQIH